MALVLKHMPLKSHPKAMDAAIASQAARRQGKAWQMHDKLFANRKALERADLVKYATEIGLDIEQFNKDLDDPKTKAEVLADQQAAAESGARSTPSCFINGLPIRGAQPLAVFDEAVRKELAAANALMQTGTPLAEVHAKSARAKLGN